MCTRKCHNNCLQLKNRRTVVWIERAGRETEKSYYTAVVEQPLPHDGFALAVSDFRPIHGEKRILGTLTNALMLNSGDVWRSFEHKPSAFYSGRVFWNPNTNQQYGQPEYLELQGTAEQYTSSISSATRLDVLINMILESLAELKTWTLKTERTSEILSTQKNNDQKEARACLDDDQTMAAIFAADCPGVARVLVNANMTRLEIKKWAENHGWFDDLLDCHWRSATDYMQSVCM